MVCNPGFANQIESADDPDPCVRRVINGPRSVQGSSQNVLCADRSSALCTHTATVTRLAASIEQGDSPAMHTPQNGSAPLQVANGQRRHRQSNMAGSTTRHLRHGAIRAHFIDGNGCALIAAACARKTKSYPVSCSMCAGVTPRAFFKVEATMLPSRRHTVSNSRGDRPARLGLIGLNSNGQSQPNAQSCQLAVGNHAGTNAPYQWQSLAQTKAPQPQLRPCFTRAAALASLTEATVALGSVELMAANLRD